MTVSTPGKTNVIFNNVPTELQILRQWVVWRWEFGGVKWTKAPYKSANAFERASHSDPKTWSSFEEAKQAYYASEDIAGIGFVFTGEDRYFGIDIDQNKPVTNPIMQNTILSLVQDVGTTYTEISPSGKGYHLIFSTAYHCSSPGVNGFRGTNIEFYSRERYFTFTGNIVSNQGVWLNSISEASYLFEKLNELNPTLALDDSISFEATSMFGRRLDLTDEQVLEWAHENAEFGQFISGQVGGQPGEWSDTHMTVLRHLDRVTGDPEQVRRIVLNSPYVINMPPSRRGEVRSARVNRLFSKELAIARVKNNSQGHAFFPGNQKFGRSSYEAILAAQTRRAQEATERLLKAQQAVQSGQVAQIFAPLLEDMHTKLRPPPGIVGEFVAATERACYLPFTKFAIPVTIASLAGIVGRGYKFEDGGGLNVNFILAATSSAGKTQTTEAWQNFLSTTAKLIDPYPGANTRTRMLKASVASVHGIYDDFMNMPSLCWVIDECANQLKAMALASTPTELQMRDAYNQLYDVAKVNAWFSLPRSVANKKAGYEDIPNLAVSTFWTTVPEKFDVYGSDAVDGFLSRVTIVRHVGEAGQRVRYPTFILPNELQSVLMTLMATAKQVDEVYSANPSEGANQIKFVSRALIDDLFWEALQLSDIVRNASLRGDLPAAYTSISRLPITALRIAGVLAVAENCYAPVVSPEQFKWALGYVLQNNLSLMHDLDKGELGAKASDEVLAVVKGVHDMLRKHKKPPEQGIRKSDLHKLMRDRSPFTKKAEAYGWSRSKLVSDTLRHMLEENMLIENTDANNSKVKYLLPTDDPIWQL